RGCRRARCGVNHRSRGRGALHHILIYLFSLWS
ncbi:unnamed protein product, partial [Mycena citricolor]